ncbi:carbohydrate esterase family 5 protein [Xylariaceae sp. FL0662B]|nr:carbohydrate esterase family 5 protein [Xylariaceae sp. FL0662B]
MKHITILLNEIAAASAAGTGKLRRQNCPNVHIIAARETTAPPGLGSASTVVNLVQEANEGATSEAIIYPAAGGKVYGASVAVGVAAVANQTNAFNRMCPESKIVMVGYSQGAQIIDDAFCGGPDGLSVKTTAPSVSSGVSDMVAAIILMGDPRHVDGLPFNVGNATAGGFAARPAGFQCTQFEDIIQAYCDAEDPFCAKGQSAATHQGYGKEYGRDALEFVQRQLNSKGSNMTTNGQSNTTADGQTDVGTSGAPTLILGVEHMLFVLILGYLYFS